MALLLSDDFTRADSALTLGSAAIGGAWTVGSNTDGGTLPVWGISSNQAYLVSTGTNVDRHAWLEAGVPDGRLLVTLVTANPEASVKAGLLFRRVDANNFWMARVNNSTDQLLLEKRVAGTVTAVQTVALVLAAGQTIALQVVADGPLISVLVDGALLVDEYADADLQLGTKHGIAANNTTGNPRFDSFSFDTLGGGGVSASVAARGSVVATVAPRGSITATVRPLE